MACGTTLAVAVGFVIGSPGTNLHNGLLAVSFVVVGDVVLRHRPAQREATLFLAAGAAEAVVFLGRQIGRQPDPVGGAVLNEWLSWMGVWPLPLVLVLVGLTIMCFPDGRLPGPPWRIAFWVTAVMGAALALMSALWPVDYARADINADHPLDLPGADVAATIFERALPITFTTFQLVWLTCVIARFRSASPAEARQLRWLVASVGVSVLVLIGGLILDGSPQAGLLTVPLIPIACGAAIIEASYEFLVRETRLSATRVVAAEDEARRRIERNLHDGAQHRLMVAGIELGRVVERADQLGDSSLVTAAAEALNQLLIAADELRELARGIHPSVLTQDGLAAALSSLADRSPFPVEIDVELAHHATPQAEATAYFVVSEALTNAARHGHAARATVRVTSTTSELEVDVIDDGRGGATIGTGIRGLTDRVTSLGGRLDIDSPLGGGTRLSACIPST